jgi:hypothetical protein
LTSISSSFSPFVACHFRGSGIREKNTESKSIEIRRQIAKK